LRSNLPHFKRQQIIGNYIADFVSLRHKLILECDGRQHYSDEGLEYDSNRTEYLKSKGFRVLRFRNDEILKNTKTALEKIQTAIDNPNIKFD